MNKCCSFSCICQCLVCNPFLPWVRIFFCLYACWFFITIFILLSICFCYTYVVYQNFQTLIPKTTFIWFTCKFLVKFGCKNWFEGIRKNSHILQILDLWKWYYTSSIRKCMVKPYNNHNMSIDSEFMIPVNRQIETKTKHNWTKSNKTKHKERGKKQNERKSTKSRKLIKNTK